MGSQVASCREAHACGNASNEAPYPYLLGSVDFISQADQKPIPERLGKYAALGQNISALDSLDTGRSDGPKVVKLTTAVLVSDLSGFTATKREHGIIHFASIVARMRQICCPIMKRRGCFHQATEGDKLIAVFTDLAACVKAALEMQLAIWEHNTSPSEEASKWRIRLNGIGVDCGHILIIDEDGHVFGDSFSRALRLSEHCCKNGNVLISGDVHAVIASDPFFGNAKFHQPERSVPIYEVRGSPGPLLYQEVSTDDASCVPLNMVTLCLRHSAGGGLENIDKKIEEQFVCQSSVLMFNLNLKAASCTDIFDVLTTKRHAMNLIIPIMRKYGGHCAEPTLWIFPNSTDAVQAAVEGKKACAVHNASAHANGMCPIEIEGWGIHEGSLLRLHGTDIHWGCPVNTASKLGQDLAKQGEILVMPEIKTALTQSFAEGDDRCKAYFFEKRALTFSKAHVDFLYYCVHTTCV